MKKVMYLFVIKALAVLAVSMIAAWNVEGSVNLADTVLVSVTEENDNRNEDSKRPIPARSCARDGEQIAGIDCAVCVLVCLFDVSGGVACGACLAACSVTPI